MVLMPDLHLEKFQLQEDGTWQKQRGGSEALKLREKKQAINLCFPLNGNAILLIRRGS